MKLPSCEISPNAPTTPTEKVALGALAFWLLIAFLAIGSVCCGCKALYENSGSTGRVGSVTAPIEISDGTDSFTCKLLFGMDGAYWYTRKDSKVAVEYDNVYTNTYIGCINTRGRQHLKVDVEPLYVGEDPATNAVSSCGEALKADAVSPLPTASSSAPSPAAE